MRILIADDHQLVIGGIKLIIQKLYPDAAVAISTTHLETISSARQQDLDLILLDLTMPGMDGFEAIDTLRNISPATPIIVLSADDSPETIQKALTYGVMGFVPKNSSNEVIRCAIELVVSGNTYIPPSLLNNGNSNHQLHQPGPANPTIKVTPRQIEILGLVKTGKTNKEIGRQLGLSEGTVRTHLVSIYNSLNVKTRTEAVHVALQHGILAS